MKRLMTIVGFVFVGILAAMLIAGPDVMAQTTPIELKYASIYAPTHPFSIADQHWMEKMEKETNGRVKFKPFWSGTMISPREGYQDAIGGVADIVYASIAYEKAGFDLNRGQGGFYQGVKDQETKLKIFWQ